MNDLISRQAAIDTEGLDEEIRCEICRNPMHTSRGCDGNCTYDEKLYEKIMQILDRRIKQLPSAQPERIKGHWVEIASSNHTYKCSVCGRLLVNITDGKNNVAKNYPYCHCGADMRCEEM